jgi:hypothetical protein
MIFFSSLLSQKHSVLFNISNFLKSSTSSVAKLVLNYIAFIYRFCKNDVFNTMDESNDENINEINADEELILKKDCDNSLNKFNNNENINNTQSSTVFSPIPLPAQNYPYSKRLFSYYNSRNSSSEVDFNSSQNQLFNDSENKDTITISSNHDPKYSSNTFDFVSAPPSPSHNPNTNLRFFLGNDHNLFANQISEFDQITVKKPPLPQNEQPPPFTSPSKNYSFSQFSCGGESSNLNHGADFQSHDFILTDIPSSIGSDSHSPLSSFFHK